MEPEKIFDHRIAEGRRVVLLAEDEPMLRNFLLLILQQSYAVLVAVDGREAIELSRAFQDEIDLLVTDMEMPNIGGDALSELIMDDRLIAFEVTPRPDVPAGQRQPDAQWRWYDPTTRRTPKYHPK